jgi:hypothetical protein
MKSSRRLPHDDLTGMRTVLTLRWSLGREKVTLIHQRRQGEFGGLEWFSLRKTVYQGEKIQPFREKHRAIRRLGLSAQQDHANCP